MHSFAALILGSVLVLAAADSRAATLTMVNQISSRLIVSVDASDGIVQAGATVELGAFIGTAEVTPPSILDPQRLIISSFTIDVPATSVDFAIGPAQIPVRLTLSAHHEWEPGHIFLLGTSRRVNPGMLVNFELNGSLEVLGESIPIAIDVADLLCPICTQLSDLPERLDPRFSVPDSVTLVIGNPDDPDSEVTMKGRGSPPNTVGSVQGIEFSIASRPAFNSITYAPEPSTSLQLASSMAVLALLRRSRRVPRIG